MTGPDEPAEEIIDQGYGAVTRPTPGAATMDPDAGADPDGPPPSPSGPLADTPTEADLADTVSGIGPAPDQQPGPTGGADSNGADR